MFHLRKKRKPDSVFLSSIRCNKPKPNKRHTHLNLHYVIGWHKANVSLHADHLPPVSLTGGCLIQDKVFALIETDRFGINRLKIVECLQHFDAVASVVVANSTTTTTTTTSSSNSSCSCTNSTTTASTFRSCCRCRCRYCCCGCCSCCCCGRCGRCCCNMSFLLIT